MNHLAILFITIFTILFLSCASENEQKALDIIAQTYNAKTIYSKNFNSKMGSKTVWEFNITVSQSNMLDSISPNPLTSNIAFVTYANFNKKEKEKYQKINVTVITSKKDTLKNSYDIPVLKAVIPKFNTYTTFSEKIMTGDFLGLNSLKENRDIPNNIDKIIESKVIALEKQNGKITDFKLYAIAVFKDNIGEVIKFTAYFKFKNGKKIPYLIVVDKTMENNKVVGFKF